MNEQKKWYITVGNERIEVSEEVYRAYWHYTEKEKYFMGKLKQEKFVANQENETVQVTPSKEDSLERLTECGLQFPDTSAPSPDDKVDDIELLVLLDKALDKLPDEERRLVQELFYLEKTEREVAQLFHTAVGTIYYRKKKVLGKLKEYLEKNS